MKQLYILLVAIFFCNESCEKQKTERPFGTLIEVPNEVISIQEEINIAQPHGTILLQPQEYYEHSINLNKLIYITSLFTNKHTAPDYIHELSFFNNIVYLSKVTTIHDFLQMHGNNNSNIKAVIFKELFINIILNQVY